MQDKVKVREYFDFKFIRLQTTPDNVFNFFYDEAIKKIKKHIWQQHWIEGMANHIAHEMAMRNMLDSAGGNAPVALQATSKTVGKLSIGYGANVSDTAYAEAGDYALTSYGRRYWYLTRYVIKPVGMII